LVVEVFVMEKEAGLTRRDFCGAAAATVTAGTLGMSTATALARQEGGDETAVRPFR
jgi:hypothetical protein